MQDRIFGNKKYMDIRSQILSAVKTQGHRSTCYPKHAGKDRYYAYESIKL